MPRGLPRAEGRKFAEARGEGRTTAVTTELLNEASRRPSGQRADADFHAAERHPFVHSSSLCGNFADAGRQAGTTRGRTCRPLPCADGSRARPASAAEA